MDGFSDNPNFLYLQVDRTSKRKDVLKYVNEELSKVLTDEGKPKFRIEGKPRTYQLQNRFNALVLRLQDWKSEDIIKGKGSKIYIRPPENKYGELNTHSIPNKKYSQIVSRMVKEGIFHVRDVANGNFGKVLKDKRGREV